MHWFRCAENCIEIGWCCHAYVIEYFTKIGMNDVHCILENKNYAKNVFWKIELEKLTNSKPGTNLSVFFLWNLPIRSYGLQWLLGRCLHNNLLCDENILWHQVTNAYHILRFSRKRHGQPSTKSIRSKVVLEVNVSRVKDKPRSRV
jgi:hypothetical protein